MLYSHKGQRPAPLPFRIRIGGGMTRTDPTTFTDEEIAEAGYTKAQPQPPYDPATEELTWNGGWAVRPLPPPPIPPVTPRQIRLALIQLGLKDQVDAYVETLDDAAKTEWEYATQVERGNPLIAAAQQGLGLSDRETDDLFRMAFTL